MNARSQADSCDMRRISSSNTFFHKRVFPVVWFGGLGLIAVVGTCVAVANRDPTALLALVPIGFMLFFGYVLMKLLVFDLVDEVWDNGDELVVRNKGQEERIPLAEIINISHPSFSNPPRATITLRQPCRFGKEITFSAQHTWFPFLKNATITELIERIDAKRRGAAL